MCKAAPFARPEPRRFSADAVPSQGRKQPHGPKGSYSQPVRRKITNNAAITMPMAARGIAAHAVEDDEVIPFVLVSLGALAAPQCVLEGELVKTKFLAEELDLIGRGVFDVQPEQRTPPGEEHVDAARVNFSNGSVRRVRDSATF